MGILEEFFEWLGTIDGGARKVEQRKQIVSNVSKFLFFANPNEVNPNAVLDAKLVNNFLTSVKDAHLQPAGIAAKVLCIRNFVDFISTKTMSTAMLKKVDTITEKPKKHYNQFTRLKHPDAKIKKADIEKIVDRMDWVVRMTGSQALISRFNKTVEAKKRPLLDNEYTFMG